MSSGMMNKLIVANVSDSQVSTTPIQRAKQQLKAEPKGDEHAHH